MRRAVLFFLLVIAGSWPLPAPAWEFRPHRALYELALAAEQGSAIASLRGHLAADFQSNCDGWTTLTRTVMELQERDGGRLAINTGQTAWESRDGLSFKFSARAGLPDGGEERTEGQAALKRLGGPGLAEFEHPAKKIFELPRGTVFPTSHTMMVLKGADAGKTLIAAPLFDGIAMEGAGEVSALIGPKLAPREAGEGASKAVGEVAGEKLAGHPSWRVGLAFYRAGSAEPEPAYEMGVRLYDNGVTDELKLDYGHFLVRGTLKRLEFYPTPDCN